MLFWAQSSEHQPISEPNARSHLTAATAAAVAVAEPVAAAKVTTMLGSVCMARRFALEGEVEFMSDVEEVLIDGMVGCRDEECHC